MVRRFFRAAAAPAAADCIIHLSATTLGNRPVRSRLRDQTPARAFPFCRVDVLGGPSRIRRYQSEENTSDGDTFSGMHRKGIRLRQAQLILGCTIRFELIPLGSKMFESDYLQYVLPAVLCDPHKHFSCSMLQKLLQ